MCGMWRGGRDSDSLDSNSDTDVRFNLRLSPFIHMASNGTTDQAPVTPLQGVNPSTPAPVDTTSVPIPDSTASPATFLAYVKGLGLHELIAACEHLLAPPVRLPPINRYDVEASEAWIDKMHVLNVS